MKHLFRSFVLVALIFAPTILFAQSQKSTAELLRENPDRAAAVHHSYEYVATPDTPAPAGYTRST